MTSHLIHIKTKDDVEWGLDATRPPDGVAALQWLELLVRKAKVGAIRSAAFSAQRSSTDAQHAGTFLLLSSASGALAVTVNTVAAGAVADATGTDTEDATALVASINADADAGGFVIASNSVATVTLASSTAGDIINLLGHQFVAGTDFSVAGNDTADAAAFVTAVRAHPQLAEQVYLNNAAGVVYVGIRPGHTPKSMILRSSNGTRLAVSNGTFAAAPNVLLWCPTPGTIGNAVVVGVSGTGLSVVGSATRLAGGAGLTTQTGTSLMFGIR